MKHLPQQALLALLTLSACTTEDTPQTGPAAATRPHEFDKPPPPPPPGLPERLAIVTVSCRIEMDGRPTGCHLVENNGDPSFTDPALEYARALVYEPEYTNHAGPVEPNHLSYIAFQRASKFEPSDVPATASTFQKLQYPATVTDRSPGHVRLTCTIGADGNTHDCAILRVDGNPAFAEAALDAARTQHYEPAWQHGHAVPEPRHTINLFFTPPPEPYPNMPAAPADIKFSKPIALARLEYPPSAEAREIEGNALILCDLGLDGINHNCTIGGVRGDPAFGPAALAYVSSQTLHATRNGTPVAVPHHATIINFTYVRNQW